MASRGGADECQAGLHAKSPVWFQEGKSKQKAGLPCDVKWVQNFQLLLNAEKISAVSSILT